MQLIFQYTGVICSGSRYGASNRAGPPADTQAAEAAAGLSGSITLAGSTSMEKFANALAEAFMEKYPDVTVQAEFTGSSAGVEAVLGGQSDVGNSSRKLKDEEKEKGAVENIVAIDGIAVVTDPANTAGGITTFITEPSQTGKMQADPTSQSW